MNYTWYTPSLNLFLSNSHFGGISASMNELKKKKKERELRTIQNYLRLYLLNGKSLFFWLYIFKTELR